MDSLAISEQNLGRIRRHYPAFVGLANRYRDDASVRNRIDSGDTSEILGDFGVRMPPGIQVRLVPNTPETFHVVLPPDPNIGLSDESLDTLSAGGKSAGSAGTAGTAGSVGTVCGTAGTVSSASSAGSAGSASS